MKTVFDSLLKPLDYDQLMAPQLRVLLAQKESELAAKDAAITATLDHVIELKDTEIAQRDRRIVLLEELLRLARIQRFAAKSEKLAFQIDLFDEAELEAAIDELAEPLPEDESAKPPRSKKRNRGFSDDLERRRIELCLSEEEKAGAERTFFSKVKEELEFIPARMTVLEYWQEKAVFVQKAESEVKETIIAAPRPIHPLGKCHASVSLLTHILVSKYADGLPLYRMESIFKRHKADVSRSNMAHWMIGLEAVFKPLLNLMREVQNSSDYLQADETRIQVLKEDGKTAQSKSWMWVIRGGPPDKPSVLFTYDPTRAGSVPAVLLDDFNGTLQCDGYIGYAAICKKNSIRRIGCWDHARRKFVEAVNAAKPLKAAGKQSKPTKADIALSKIRKLYRIEKKIADFEDAKKYEVRQTISLPILNELKVWLEKNVGRVMKGGHTRKAMEYTLNQWPSLLGYCEQGCLNISNALAENAIRPFAVGRKAWLFADTSRGAIASAACYSLIETAKANDLEPYAYIRYVLEHVGAADTLEKWEALLPWNVPLEKFSKKVPQAGEGK